MPHQDPAAVPSPQQATRFLLARMGLPDLPQAAPALRFMGSDPVVASPNAYGTATASALAAFGVATCELWRMRTGRRQQLEIDLHRAVSHGLRSVLLLRQNGHAFGIAGNSRKVNNFFPTRDGRRMYLLRMTDYPSVLARLLGVLRCPNEQEALAQAVRQWDGLALEEALAAARAFGVLARSPEEWRAHPQGAWLQGRPGFELRRIGDSAPEPLRDGTRPLSGLRVLDAAHVIAGPAAARLLAEQGAEVLRTAAPSQLDPQPIVIDTGFGKRSAFIDLDRIEDAGQLKRLAAQADVFVESWRPGAMAKRGFSPSDLAAIRPGIVVVSVSCYGDGGPWRARAGYEPVAQAACGLASVEGTPERPQTAPTVTMNDYLAAYLAAAGAVGALVRRAREGGSWHVSTSLTQASMWVLAQGRVRLAEGQQVPGLDGPTPPGWMAHTSSCFGELEHAAPVVQFSDTPGGWDTPPQPFGASLAEWRTR